MMWGFGGFGLLWMGLFWIAAMALLVWAVSRPASTSPTARRRSALEILEERFARSEIDAEEFNARRNELAR